MSPEKSKELISICPELFSDLHEKSCMYLFGFECGDGWFELLKDLITEIREICRIEGFSRCTWLTEEPSDIKVDQVKEKYGTLRFYTNWSMDEIDRVITIAEEKSAKTCEGCGGEGKMIRTGGWDHVSCQECSKSS
jgi:hypothetical protein